MRNKRYIGIDLFAGAGGLTLAAQRQGMHVLAAVEHDKWSCRTYLRNFIGNGSESISPALYESDLTSLDARNMLSHLELNRGQLDILMGGPPCQGFSTHRIKGAGISDPRNELLLRYILFVEILQPKAFLVENVPGLLWPRHREYLENFKRLVGSAGYHLYGPQSLNARDYGVPQNRVRVFMIGIRKDIENVFCWPRPTHFAPNSSEVVNKGYSPWRNAEVVFKKPLKPTTKDPNAVHMNHTEHMIKRFEATPKNGGSRKDSGFTLRCHKEHNGHKDVYGRIDPKRPGPTMTTACINPSKGRFVHPTENHGITVRHAARFQAFPDEFVFEGGLIAAGRQVGNAVPINVGEVLINSLREKLLL